jgi:hypothetical protein
MSLRISSRVAMYYERAADCHERAQKANTPAEREFFLDTERCCLSLAHHHDLSERLIGISKAMAKRINRNW